ncbi:MAG: signal peptidase I [Acidobacteriaceae bacterium]|nr:signal peptidase I [Acidobacteriaceae bacterium]
MKHPHRPHVAEVFRTLLELLVVASFVMTFVIQPIRIPSVSMQPTMRVGDFVFGNKQAFAQEGLWSRLLPRTTIRRGDLAVFIFPPDPGKDLVKRIVGLPGDHLRLHNGHVLINGQTLPESYAFYSPAPLEPFRDDFPFLRSIDPNVDPVWWRTLRTSARTGEIVVPAGQYFMLGDNRNESEDSRYWGFVSRNALLAEPAVVYLSTATEHRGSLLSRLRGLWAGFRRLR